MTTASKITMIRVVLLPVFIVLMLADFPANTWYALGVFIVSSLTDTIDGIVARKYDQVSVFGKFIDPLADKLLVIAALLLFVENGQMTSWAAMIVITRELAVTGLRLIAVENGVVIAAARSGKVKTFTSLVAICIMLTPWHDLPLFGGYDVDALMVFCILVTTVYSGAEYFAKNGKLLNLKK